MSMKDFTNKMIHEMVISNLAENKNISLDEAKDIVSKMSFMEYHKLSEASADIAPPSGNTIGTSGTTGTSANRGQQQPGRTQSTWTGKGPISAGMTVGLRNKAGMSTPAEVSQVDQGANGVQVKDPKTGKTEWHNISTLEPYMVGRSDDQSKLSTRPGEEGFPMHALMQMEEQKELSRIKELAGIQENCSGGATGAGAIAIAPVAMGSVKKRQPTDEELKTEYTPKTAAKTIIGDTKPAQASGKLSADLAASGKLSAGRTRNGKKAR
jgi:hypothetical protein